MPQINILASSSKGNAYIVREGEKSILIDPGIPIFELKKRSKFTLSSVELCLLSHEHKDHSKAIGDIYDMGIPCAMSNGTYEGLNGYGDFESAPIILESGKELTMAGWTILPFGIQHDAIEPLGFLIKTPKGDKICYATDTYYIKYRFSGVNIWMIECNHDSKTLARNSRLPQSIKDRITTNHFELSNVKKFFKSQDMSKTKRIYLIHLSDDNSDPARFIEEIEKVTGIPVEHSRDPV